MDLNYFCNLYVIKSFSDRSSSIIDALIPLVEYAISILGTQYIEKTDLIQAVRTQSGIEIPNITMDTILNKMRANKQIKTFKANDTFQLLSNYRGSDEYLDALEGSKRKTIGFIDSFISYSKTKPSREIALKSLELLLTNYLGWISDRKDENEKEENIGSINSDFVSFIEHICQADDDNYHIFEGIFYGFLVQNLVKNNNTNNETSKLSDIIVYLDSNFILRLLDYQPEPCCKATQELFAMIKEAGLRPKVFEITIQEAQGAICKGLNYYEHNMDTIEAIYKDQTQYIDGVEGAIFRRKDRTVSSIQDEVANMKAILLGKDIAYDNANISSISVDEKLLDKLSRKKEKKTNLNFENTDNLRLKNAIRENALADLQIITKLRNIRTGKQYGFANCQVIFLTCDNVLYEFNNFKHKDSRTIPECINEETMANMLFMLNPQRFCSASLELFISVISSSSYVKIESLQSFHRALLAYVDKNPGSQAFLNNLFSNQSLFSDISDFDSIDDADTDARIACLITEARKQTESLQNDINRTTETEKTLKEAQEKLKRENEELKKQIEGLTADPISTPPNICNIPPVNKLQDKGGAERAVYYLSSVLLFGVLYAILAFLIISIATELRATSVNAFAVASLVGIGAFILALPILAIRKNRFKNIINDVLNHTSSKTIWIKVGKILGLAFFAAISGFAIPLGVNLLSSIILNFAQIP